MAARGHGGVVTSDDTLPETIGVRLISANGEVNAIGTLHTRTGEVSFDSEAWYTLDGSGPDTLQGHAKSGEETEDTWYDLE